MSKPQYPQIGAEISIEYPPGINQDLRVIHAFGAGRLFQVVNTAGESAVLLLQPDGGWWMVRDFEACTGEEWKSDDAG